MLYVLRRESQEEKNIDEQIETGIGWPRMNLLSPISY